MAKKTTAEPLAQETEKTEGATQEVLESVPAPTGDRTPVTRIYAGPTMHRRIIIAGSVYRGGLPVQIEKLVEKVPEVSRLLVLIENFITVRKATQTQGTEEHRIYHGLLVVRFDENGEVRQ